MADIEDLVKTYLQSGQTASQERVYGPVPDVTPTERPIGGSSEYDFNYRQFPLDLGADYNSHYVVFNINVPVKNGADGQFRTPQLYNNGDDGLGFTQATDTGGYSKVDQLRFNGGTPSFNLSEGMGAGIPRYTRRITESIALHMPSPLTYTSTNMYEDVSLTSFAAQVGKLAISPAAAIIKGHYAKRLSDSQRAAAGGAGKILTGAGDLIGTGMQLAGYPINPRMEVLFANTIQRQFAFEFLMAPRNEEESIAMDKIIRTFKFHGAPALSTDEAEDSGNGFWSNFGVGIASKLIPWYVPPAEFDITFFQGGIENDILPRINTCVLERIEVDFQPQGMYATFSNGYPVACRLSMAFRETEVITKQRVIEGF